MVLPNEGEVRMLVDPIVLELLLTGRPKAATLPQVRLHTEQLQCVIRLTRVSGGLAGNIFNIGIISIASCDWLAYHIGFV